MRQMRFFAASLILVAAASEAIAASPSILRFETAKIFDSGIQLVYENPNGGQHFDRGRFPRTIHRQALKDLTNHLQDNKALQQAAKKGDKRAIARIIAKVTETDEPLIISIDGDVVTARAKCCESVIKLKF